MLNSNKKRKVILFSIYGNFFERGSENKIFMNTVKFLKSYFEKDRYKVIICSFNNTLKNSLSNKHFITTTRFLKGVELIFYKRIFPRKKNIFKLMEYIINSFRFFCVIYKYRPAIIYAYGEAPLFLSVMSKTYFCYKLVFDMRGDYIDELKQLGSPNWKLNLLQKWLKFSLNKADKVLFISSTGIKEGKTQKYIPHYNYYDRQFFYFADGEFEKNKRQLSLSEKFVFVYSGSSHHYQMIEKTFFFFSEFYKRHNDSFFMILTEYPEYNFDSCINKFNVLPENYFIKCMKHEDVCKILMVADLGFLIRDNLPLNHHSFPTKFAEYLASGVPVLTTPYVHTIVPMIIKNGLGKVIELKDNYEKEIDEIYNKFKNNIEIKKRCALYAQEELSWQKKSRDLYFNIRQ